MKEKPKDLREHVVELLRGGHAHPDVEKTLKKVPPALRGVKPDGAEHTLWQLLEHVRIAQWDILEFSRNPGHVSPDWPEGYWPSLDSPPDENAWEASVRMVRRDLEAMEALVLDPSLDLLTPFAHGQGQSLLREALLLADHNAYHVGQIVLVRRQLGLWPPAK